MAHLDTPMTTSLPALPSRRALERAAMGVAWLSLLVAPITLWLGHMGTRLNWRTTHISWYAARAPQGDWVTLTMALVIVAMVAAASQLSRGLRPRWWSWALSLLFLAAAFGLGVLAYHEVDVARGAHNRGLLLFFVAASLGLFLSGLTASLMRRGWAQRLVGLAVSMSAALSVGVYTRWLGLDLHRGVRQRLAFLCMWCAALGLLWLVSVTQAQRSQVTAARSEVSSR